MDSAHESLEGKYIHRRNQNKNIKVGQHAAIESSHTVKRKRTFSVRRTFDLYGNDVAGWNVLYGHIYAQLHWLEIKLQNVF